MKALPIFLGDLAGAWRGLIAWAVAVVAILALYLPIYPSMKSPDLQQMIDTLPSQLTEALGYDQISSGAGYTQATFFGLIGFVVAAIATIAWGASATAGREESGQLELILAHAVGRVQFAVESAAALVVKLAVIGVVGYLTIMVLNSPSELEITAGNLLAVILAWAGLGALCGAAAHAAGAITGHHGWAVGAGAAVAVLGYALNAVANMNSDLDWLQPLSPYYWAYGRTPLSSGFDWWGLALLWGGAVVLFAAGAAVLARRDISG